MTRTNIQNIIPDDVKNILDAFHGSSHTVVLKAGLAPPNFPDIDRQELLKFSRKLGLPLTDQDFPNAPYWFVKSGFFWFWLQFVNGN